jgi:hypothetical protein
LVAEPAERGVDVTGSSYGLVSQLADIVGDDREALSRFS